MEDMLKRYIMKANTELLVKLKREDTTLRTQDTIKPLDMTSILKTPKSLQRREALNSIKNLNTVKNNISYLYNNFS